MEKLIQYINEMKEYYTSVSKDLDWSSEEKKLAEHSINIYNDLLSKIKGTGIHN